MTERWPAISYDRWAATCDTLHAHTQLLGKMAVELAPPEPELLHAALRLTAPAWRPGRCARRTVPGRWWWGVTCTRTWRWWSTAGDRCSGCGSPRSGRWPT